MKDWFDYFFPKASEFNEYGRPIRKKEVNVETIMFSGFNFLLTWGVSLYGILTEDKNIKTAISSIIIITLCIAIAALRFFKNRNNYTGHGNPFITYGEIAKSMLYCFLCLIAFLLISLALNFFGIIDFSLKKQ